MSGEHGCHGLQIGCLIKENLSSADEHPDYGRPEAASSDF